MHTLDWESLLKTHPVFELLGEHERRAILDERVATERTYQEGEKIFRQGEIGTSVYVIGQGSVEIVLEREGEERVVIYSIGQGELFGEMALIEDRPRSATMVAADRTVLIEIDGDVFLDLLRTNAEVALVILERMSRRLRMTDSRITAHRLCEHDDTIALLQGKVEAAMKSSEARLAASQTMYDQTAKRANEIIESADRARNTMKWSLSTAAAVLALLGGFGLWDIKQMRSNVQDDRTQVQQDRDAINALRAELETKKSEIDAQQAALKAAQQDVDAELTILRTAAQRVRTYAENAEAEHRTEVMLAELGTLEFGENLMDAMATELNRFDTTTVQRIGITLTNLLRRDKAFHDGLAPLLDEEKVTNPDGRLFLSYYFALSALSEGAATQVYATHKNKLENLVMLSADPLGKPGYVSRNTGRILKASLGRAAPDEDEKAARASEIEQLMDLIALIKEP